jgi:hypothetical protein
MKKILPLLVAFSVASHLHAQKLEWVYTAEGGEADARAVTTDRDGNVYATGTFSGQVTFRPGAGQIRLTAQANDVFVAKFDRHGVPRWVIQMGGAGDDEGNAIAVDSLGNVYTTGFFNGTADFNPDPVLKEELTVAGGSDIFVSKLDSNGHYLWARHFGSTGFDRGYGIAVDKGGHVFTTGFFTNTVDFAPGSAVAPLTSAGSYDIFISKLDADGNYVWAGQMGGAGEDQGRALVLDDTGNVYITGHFYLSGVHPAADFDPDPLVAAPLFSNGGYDVFVSKLRSDGSYVWAKNLGGSSGGSNYGDFGRAVAVDKDGHVYTAGYFQGSADFNPGTGTHLLTATGIRDVFVSKLDASGEFVWAERIGSDQSVECYALTVDDSANVVFTGTFEGVADFNPGPGTAELVSMGNQDIFICKWDKDAEYRWALSMGSTGSGFNRTDVGEGVAVDPEGYIYTVGSFHHIVDFDPGPATLNRFASGNNTNMFLHKMGLCHPTVGSLVIDSVCSQISINGTLYTQSGTYTQVMKNSCGMDSTLTITVTIHPRPDTTVANDGITLTAMPAEGYQWLDCWNGNQPISGATGQTYAPPQDGHYAVALTGTGGCSDTSRCHAFVKRVGVSGISPQPMSIAAYPNPFSGRLHITASQPFEGAFIMLTDVLGRFVTEPESVSDRAHFINTELLPAGIYLLTIKKKGSNTVRVKLIKE